MEVAFGAFSGGGGLSSPASGDYLNLVSSRLATSRQLPALDVRHDTARQALIVTKSCAGFPDQVVAELRSLIREVAGGQLGSLKFIAFEFTHPALTLSTGGEGFEGLLDELGNLILAAPVISIASARADLAGADLEFALACSMMVAERGRRFSFAADPTVSLGVYGLLAMKLGFVQAERLMEQGEVVGADVLHALMLLKAVGGNDVLEEVLDRTARRHNSSYGIYRAQRISVRAVQRDLRG